MEAIRCVLPQPDGRWAVRVPGARRLSSTHHERYDAVAVARRTLQNLGGGFVQVCDADGSVIESHEVAPVRNRRVGNLRTG